MRVLVIGGGVAGLSAATYLSYYRKFKVVLIDKNLNFINQLLLHQALHKPITSFLTPYKTLASLYGFTYKNAEVELSEENINEFSRTGKLPTKNESLDFDHLVIATGASPIKVDNMQSSIQTLNLDDLKSGTVYEKQIRANVHNIVFVGGGATSIQVLFELKDLLESQKKKVKISLVDMEEEVLSTMPEGVRCYTKEKLKKEGINYYPKTQYLENTERGIEVKNLSSGREEEIKADIVFLLLGVKPKPYQILTNEYGQVISKTGMILDNVYSVGDCSRFLGGGLNSLSAQAAVRKGRVVAHNIKTSLYWGEKYPYTYKALGYFVNLGFKDAVGWAFSENVLLHRLPAIAMKEAIDRQFELVLKGYNTYFDY